MLTPTSCFVQSPSMTVQPFIRSLNTALSLRYPLRSAGDPFHYVSSSVPGIQLTSVINCLPLTRNDCAALPLEALPSHAFVNSLESTVVLPMSLSHSLLPLLRLSHDPSGLPATFITCLRATDRFVGTPFTGSTSAVPGIANNALASALDVLRRELSLVESRSRRNVKIVNVDVGFLQPVNTRKSHRGVSHSPENRSTGTSSLDIERSLPAHLREMYAPALLANYDARTQSARHRMPDAGALSDKLLGIVLAKKARHIPERASVGVGGRLLSFAQRPSLCGTPANTRPLQCEATTLPLYYRRPSLTYFSLSANVSLRGSWTSQTIRSVELPAGRTRTPKSVGLYLFPDKICAWVKRELTLLKKNPSALTMKKRSCRRMLHLRRDQCIPRRRLASRRVPLTRKAVCTQMERAIRLHLILDI